MHNTVRDLTGSLMSCTEMEEIADDDLPMYVCTYMVIKVGRHRMTRIYSHTLTYVCMYVLVQLQLQVLYFRSQVNYSRRPC